uniref:T-cell surface glycoprotein CD3 zeta chain n=1 Tax=Bos mutus grunniens TaxID=30521 RepID=A0A8B9WXU6_BOSMU
MKWTALVIVAILQAQFPITAAQSFGLLDPKLCYLLDGILFIYGVIVTALFLRAKFSRSANAPAYQQGQNPVYNELNVGRREEYAVLDRRGGFDPEKGGKPVGPFCVCMCVCECECVCGLSQAVGRGLLGASARFTMLDLEVRGLARRTVGHHPVLRRRPGLLSASHGPSQHECGNANTRLSAALPFQL